MKYSCNIVTNEFLDKLEVIEPSIYLVGKSLRKHYPCRLILKDGKVVPRVICFEEHRGFTSNSWIHPDSISLIEPTPERMPAPLASKLYSAGESGMGYEIFRMEMKDGTSHIFVTNNIVDYPDYPEGYEDKDVAEVYPHEGREQSRYGYRRDRNFVWYFFVKQ